MSNRKHCSCDTPFSDCPHAMETPHGDKWYCTLPKNKNEMIEQKHWATTLKKGDEVKGTIRHATDGTQNRKNVELIVIENFPSANKIIAKDGKSEVVVPYNELKKQAHA